MINISANQKFQVPCDKFSIYAASSCQLSISIDGVNFTNTGDAFTGTKSFKDNPRGLFIKASVDIGLAY